MVASANKLQKYSRHSTLAKLVGINPKIYHLNDHKTFI